VRVPLRLCAAASIFFFPRRRALCHCWVRPLSFLCCGVLFGCHFNNRLNSCVNSSELI
jgi:hypothetical protein